MGFAAWELLNVVHFTLVNAHPLFPASKTDDNAIVYCENCNVGVHQVCVDSVSSEGFKLYFSTATEFLKFRRTFGSAISAKSELWILFARYVSEEGAHSRGL